MKAFWNSFSNLWCQTMHPDPMWPVNGQYRCPSCLRVYSVPWEEHKTAARRTVAAGPHAREVARTVIT